MDQLKNIISDMDKTIRARFKESFDKVVVNFEQVFRDLLPKDKPVLIGYSCGHARPTMTLPFGANVRLDTASCTLSVL